MLKILILPSKILLCRQGEQQCIVIVMLYTGVVQTKKLSMPNFFKSATIGVVASISDFFNILAGLRPSGTYHT